MNKPEYWRWLWYRHNFQSQTQFLWETVINLLKNYLQNLFYLLLEDGLMKSCMLSIYEKGMIGPQLI